MKKWKYFAAALSVALGTGVTSAKACDAVSITEMNWASAQIVTAVSKFLLEQGYGCKVTTMPSSVAPAVTSVAETGKPDILTEVTVNSFPPYRDLLAEGKLLQVANVLQNGVDEGWYVPSYLVEAHPELKTIDGILANPKLVGSRFHNCPEGWGCRVKNDHLKVAFGLEGAGIEVFNHGSGETLASSAASAVTAKEPWFGYNWSPSTVVGKYNLVKIDMGPFDADAYKCVADKAGCANPKKTSYPPSEVVTAVTPALKEREPEVVELMSKVSFPNDVMAQLLAWQGDNKASADEAAAHFIGGHSELWSTWINEDARKRLANLIK